MDQAQLTAGDEINVTEEDAACRRGARVLTRAEERLLRALRQRRRREAEGSFLVEGVRATEDLVASVLAIRFLGYVPSLEDTARGATLLRAAEARGVSLRPLTQGVFEEFADTENPQGVLAVAETPTWRLDHLRPSGADGVILILDAVQDPGNFGALARSAEALGALGIIALPGTVDAWNPKAVRAAMGSTFRLPIIGAGWEAAAPWLAAEGFAILAATAAGEPLRDRPRRAALVVGNEGAGISPESLRHAALQVGIPLRGRAESLGVTAAAAILLHALLQSR